ncbi:tRNA pseudouridine(38-40) synthase TruA [Neisseriaceae bacterium PsAf]|nr:tRNA pseudouridine(38-40) synthase TruA [Neisseriaceae bacterium PsAf]
MKRRVALCFCYQGTAYNGWQKQKEIRNTIQEVMEKAIAQIAQHPVELIASGRTDRGVHALRQVAHFDTTAVRDSPAWLFGVNRYLPEDIAIQTVTEVDFDFHARFSAQQRFYRYVLYPAQIRPVFLKNKVGWFFQSLDVKVMNEAIQLLLGEHDFSSFRSADCQAKTPVKIISHARVYLFQGLICFDMAANGFLHHMVRNIVGALIYVGVGRWSIEQFRILLAEKSRQKAPPTFSGDGLYFLGAAYPKNYHLEIPDIPECFWGNNEFINQG